MLLLQSAYQKSLEVNMISLRIVLLLLALISFVLAAIGVPSSRINLTALGLSFWVLSLIVT
jgi:hypothetical protein